MHLNVDRLIRFDTVVSNDDTIVWDGRTTRRYVASVLVFIVIIGGIAVDQQDQGLGPERGFVWEHE